jgi:arsenate reductase
MKKVLVICTGNSCRSIMAEGIINHYLKGEWEAYSAGTHPSYVHPYAKKALEEMGITTDSLRSKSISEFWHMEDLDLIITVCDHAQANCPAFYMNIPRLHIPLNDPVRFVPGDDDVMAGFREVREDILKVILPILKTR